MDNDELFAFVQKIPNEDDHVQVQLIITVVLRVC